MGFMTLVDGVIFRLLEVNQGGSRLGDFDEKPDALVMENGFSSLQRLENQIELAIFRGFRGGEIRLDGFHGMEAGLDGQAFLGGPPCLAG